MNGTRILVVDDDRAVRHVVASFLRDEGFEVDTAADGEEALRLVSDEEPFQVAVLDYQMPGMNGVELFEELRQRQPDIQGVFLTAYTTIDVVFPAVGVGVERVLSKPVDRKELVPVVKEVLAHAG